MTHRWRVVAAISAPVLALCLAGCSSGGPAAAPSTTQGPSRAGASPTTTTLPADIRALTGQLLSAADLPTGWVVTATSPMAATPAGLPATSCLSVLQRLASTGGGLNAVYTKSATGEQLTEQLGAYPSAAAATTAYQAAVSALGTCKVVTLAVGGAKGAGSLQPSALGTVATQSSSYLLTVTTGTTSDTSAVVVGQKGSTVGVLLLTPAPKAGSPELAQLAHVAYDKVSR